MRYARNLHYEEDPDYNIMKSFFKKVMDDNQLENDNKFDWIKENERDIISTNFTSNRNQQPVNVKSYIYFLNIETIGNIKKLDCTQKISDLTIGVKQNVSHYYNQQEIANNELCPVQSIKENPEFINLNNARTLKTKISGLQGKDKNIVGNVLCKEEYNIYNVKRG